MARRTSMRNRPWVVVWLLVIPSIGPAAEPKTKVPTDLDVAYAKVGDKELKLDLARPPDGNGPFPVVVCFHGGGWRMGNKRDVRSWLPFFAEHGYVAASVGYRLAPDYTFPAQIEDA